MTRRLAVFSAFLFAALLVVIFGNASAVAQDKKVATFAGGCFWCIESDFDHIPGVLETVSGYTGGHTEAPTYKKVSSGGTGHFEALRITYDSARVSYDDLLEAFWHSVDPLDAGGQFCDRGDTYRTAVFVDDKAERKLAEASLVRAEKELGQKIVTPILDATTFFAAEDYHQGYAMKNPVRYKYYRWSCGRNQRVEALWGDKAYKGIDKEG